MFKWKKETPLTVDEMSEKVWLHKHRFGKVEYILIHPAKFAELASDKKANEHITFEDMGPPQHFHHKYDGIPLLIDDKTEEYSIKHEIPEEFKRS